ncbi:MAG: helix-turn-helix transcriptional regulator [Oscillospiraceae bacterium]|nr:helix-turn-helix transcriptional regulator [Oscillospiraceae bacterium]
MARNGFTCDCRAVNTAAVEKIQMSMPGGEFFSGLAGFYRIMGDPTRCAIIYALSQRELCVCDLASLLGMTKSSISHQLSKMKVQGVVKCRREGKEVYYSLDDEHVACIFALTMTHLEHMGGSACR